MSNPLEKGKPEMEYASAIISFLDRDSQTVTAMTYPITRIELKEMRGDEIVTARTFYVGDDGRWVETEQ